MFDPDENQAELEIDNEIESKCENDEEIVEFEFDPSEESGILMDLPEEFEEEEESEDETELRWKS